MKIFVSYSHEDLLLVEEDIRWLTAEGYEVAYDKQIVPSSDWREHIAEDLITSSLVLFYSSRSSNASKHCVAEMGFALDLDKFALVVKLDSTELVPGLRMYLGGTQALDRSPEKTRNYQEALRSAIDFQGRLRIGPGEDLAYTSVAVSLGAVTNATDVPDLKAFLEAFLRYCSASADVLNFKEPDTPAETTQAILEYRISAEVDSTPTGITTLVRLDSGENNIEELTFSCDRSPSEFVTAFYRSLERALTRKSIELPQLREAIVDADTLNWEAMLHYLLGLSFHHGDDQYGALGEFDTALNIDPGFVFAMRSAANDANNLGDKEKARRLYARALQNQDHLSESQQHATRAWYYTTLGDYARAVDAWKSYTPTSANEKRIALTNLALAQLYSRETSAALASAEAAGRVSGKDYFSKANVAMYLMYAGEFQDCEKQLLEIGVRGTSYHLAVTMAICQTMLDRPDEASRIYESLQLGNEFQRAAGTLGLADQAAYQAEYTKACDTILESLSIAENGLTNTMHAYSAIYSGLAGESDLPSGAKALLDGLNTADLDRTLCYLLGRGCILHGNLELANSVSDYLKKRFEHDARIYADLLRAESFIQNETFTDASELLIASNRSLDTWMGHFLSAQVFARAGADMEAMIELQTCVKRGGEAVSFMFDEIPTTHLYEHARQQYEQLRASI